MHIVFLTHPAFSSHQSMPRFAGMLAEGMKRRGHSVETWSPEARFFKLPFPGFFKKWLGYVDQFLLFPAEVRKKLAAVPTDTLFVFTDHALGPWVPLVAHRPNVIHCHDFLAQRSANGLIPENKTSWSGKKYQAMIRRGYAQGENFISVSEKTNKDLIAFLGHRPQLAEVVYNGLNGSFHPQDVKEIRKSLSSQTGLPLEEGYILHVGGNQWYKNRHGVLEIYEIWRSHFNKHLPLLLIGESPEDSLNNNLLKSNFSKDIFVLDHAGDQTVRDAYAGATVLLFPSLAEGFGWPIAEAMASGCPVITTQEAPMTEVAGEAAFYINRKPESSEMTAVWAAESAAVLNKVIHLEDPVRHSVVQRGMMNAKRFDPDTSLNRIEGIYQSILDKNYNL